MKLVLVLAVAPLFEAIDVWSVPVTTTPPVNVCGAKVPLSATPPIPHLKTSVLPSPVLVSPPVPEIK